MKAVLISIQPKWCELIASGKKTAEVRKTAPKSKTPFKVYIYCTNSKEKLWVLKETERAFTPEKIASICAAKDVGGTYKANGKVIGEFVCDRIITYNETFFDEQEPRDTDKIAELLDLTCLTYSELCAYVGLNDFYGWHISDLVIYDKPRELSEFYVWKKCNSCRETGYESTACCYDEDCKVPAVIARPPQSWCYVESEDTE